MQKCDTSATRFIEDGRLFASREYVYSQIQKKSNLQRLQHFSYWSYLFDKLRITGSYISRTIVLNIVVILLDKSLFSLIIKARYSSRSLTFHFDLDEF